jgi:hypothetical protein
VTKLPPAETSSTSPITPPNRAARPGPARMLWKANELLASPSDAWSWADSCTPSNRGANAARTITSGTSVRKACAARTSARSNASIVVT